MDKLISSFSKQLKDAITISESSTLSQINTRITNVIVSGLGGSGIGGHLVGDIIRSEIEVPFMVNRDYFVPNFVDQETLVIISSYSGNTEETISSFISAAEKNAHIVCITSGGKIEEMALANKCDLIKIPGGMPPRACLGYSIVQQLHILAHFKLIKQNFTSQIEAIADLLEEDTTQIKDQGKSIAAQLSGKTPVIYVENNMESVALRWRQQLNENSKVLCWHNVIPEMNHNELVGWTSSNNNVVVLYLRSDIEYTRNKERIQINIEIIEKYCSVIQISSKGESLLEKAIYLINIGDWVSWFLAKDNGADAMEVDVLDYLKEELGKR